MLQKDINFLNDAETPDEEYDDGAFFDYSCRPRKQTNSKFARLGGH